MNERTDRTPESGGGGELRCNEVSLRLHELLAGELHGDAARAVARHVEQCARCARERADLQALSRLFARDATPPPSEIAEARLKLRRALARERSTGRAAPAGAWRVRLLWRELPKAAGFALLLALFVPVFPRLHRSMAPVSPNDMAASLAHGAHELVASVGTWLPTLPEWRLPAAPPESLRTWFGALHSDAH